MEADRSNSACNSDIFNQKTTNLENDLSWADDETHYIYLLIYELLTCKFQLQ